MAKVFSKAKCTLKLGRKHFEPGMNVVPDSMLTNVDVQAELKRGTFVLQEPIKHEREDRAEIEVESKPKQKSKSKKSKPKIVKTEKVESGIDEEPKIKETSMLGKLNYGAHKDEGD